MGRGEGVIENPSAVKDPQVSLESGIFFNQLEKGPKSSNQPNLSISYLPLLL